LGLLALSPAIFLLSLVARYGVDIPFADEWTFAPLLVKAHTHTLAFSDFFAQHNEHRYVFPRLVLIALAEVAHGNVRVQMFLSVFLCGLTSLNLWFILRRTLSLSTEKRLLLLALLNLVLFSPVQAENWTWGFQFVLFLINFLLTAGVAVATSELSMPRKFVLCVVIAFVATFSFGNGFLLWVTTFPLALVFREQPSLKRRLVWLAGWGAAFAGAISIYFIHYVKPAHHPSVAASGNPVDYFLYVVTFLGAHLSQAARTESIVLPAILGTFLLIIYVSASGFVVFRGKPLLFGQAVPWIGIGGFALGSALLAALTRIGFGVNQGLDSRYTTFSLCLSVSVIGLAAITGEALHSSYGRNERFRHSYLRVETACLTAFLFVLFVSAAWGVRSMQALERSRLWGKGALLLGNVVNDAIVYETYLGGWAPDVLRFANMEDAIGLLHPPMFRTAKLSQLPTVAATRFVPGYVDTITPSDGPCEISGWAVLPNQRRVADCVVVAYDSAGHEPTIFGVTDQVNDRPDAAQALGRKHLLRCGWAVHFPRSAIPRGEQHISAWALDAKIGKFYELGSMQVLP
jgi:hypothetical protein